MFHIEFTFAGRTVQNPHLHFCHAIKQAQHITRAWPESIPTVKLLGHRRDGYPLFATIKRRDSECPST